MLIYPFWTLSRTLKKTMPKTVRPLLVVFWRDWTHQTRVGIVGILGRCLISLNLCEYEPPRGGSDEFIIFETEGVTKWLEPRRGTRTGDG